jgi:hypothetical protein
LQAFRLSASPEQPVYALDWEHAEYRFWPHWMPTEAEWEIDPVLVGDEAVFVAPGFEWGLISLYDYSYTHPGTYLWDVCVFGERLVAALARRRPRMFHRIVSVDGKPVDGKPMEGAE